VALIALAGVSAASVLYGTRVGIGLSNDSVNYLRAARGLLDGRGLIVMQAIHYAGAVPMTHWPPLYPLLLATSGWLGLDMEGFARALNALLLAANILLIGLFARGRGGGRIAALVAALLVATNLQILNVHQMLWTEPLYLFTTFLALALLAQHLEAPRPPLLYSAGACAALAAMTRYVGVAVVGAGGLGLLLWSRGPLASRVRDAIRFGALPGAAVALWSLRNRWVTDAPTYGKMSSGLPELAPLLKPTGMALASWLWPFSTGLVGWGSRSGTLAGAVLLGASAALALAVLAWHSPAAIGERRVAAGVPLGGRRAAPLLVLYALCHAAFLYGTVLVLFDAFVPDERHLLPATLALVLALACVASRPAVGARHPRLFAVVLVGLGALVVAHGARAVRYQSNDARLGFRDLRYTRSGLIALARGLPAGTPIFTNSQAVAGLARMDDMRFLPAKRSPQRTDPNPEYAAQLRDMERELREHRGVIIVFDEVGGVFPDSLELERVLPLRQLLAEPQGRAFALRDSERDARQPR
jgi:4-amino-4-deoxy-L-arabinose transferase-like glycosyltransferase